MCLHRRKNKAGDREAEIWDRGRVIKLPIKQQPSGEASFSILTQIYNVILRDTLVDKHPNVKAEKTLTPVKSKDPSKVNANLDRRR